MTDSLVLEQDSETGGTAVFSPCRAYRYSLTRVVSASRAVCLFVLINPSTADASKNDRTVRRCMAFAAREGCGLVRVVNLYAWRATDPCEVWALCSAGDRAIGPANDDVIARATDDADLIVAGWGGVTLRSVRARALEVTDRLRRVRRVDCLGTTKGGDPKHPLARGRNRIPDGQPLIPFAEVCQTHIATIDLSAQSLWRSLGGEPGGKA